MAQAPGTAGVACVPCTAPVDQGRPASGHDASLEALADLLQLAPSKKLARTIGDPRARALIRWPRGKKVSPVVRNISGRVVGVGNRALALRVGRVVVAVIIPQASAGCSSPSWWTRRAGTVEGLTAYGDPVRDVDWIARSTGGVLDVEALGMHLLPLCLIPISSPPPAPLPLLPVDAALVESVRTVLEELDAQDEARRHIAAAAPRPPSARTKQNKKRHRRHAAKKNRFAEFADFLLARCGGAAGLNSGIGVLDVAGGKGTLGVELCVRRGVRVTVVDPAQFPLSKYQSKLLLSHCTKLFFRQQQLQQQLGRERQRAEQCDASVSAPASADGEKTAVADCRASTSASSDGLSLSLRTWIHPKVAAAEDKAEQMAHLAAVEVHVPLRIERRLFDAAFVGEEGGTSEDAANTGAGSTTTTTPTTTHAALFARASVVLGLHPDQATEPIVRHCLAAGKPFAVIPCCVFPDANPHRRLPDGSGPVRLLPDFVKWLSALSPEIHCEPLVNVPGCNMVLHYRLDRVGGGEGGDAGGNGSRV